MISRVLANTPRGTENFDSNLIDLSRFGKVKILRFYIKLKSHSTLLIIVFSNSLR